MDDVRPLILGGRPAQELVGKILQEFAGDHGTPLALCRHEIVEFPDTEVKPRILDNVRGRQVVVVQSACAFQGRTIDTALRELYLLNEALGRASVGEVTVLLPYYPYGRQDRKDEGRTSVSASLIAREIEVSLECVPVKRIVFVDLHNPAIEGFFRSVPPNHLTAFTHFVPHLVAAGFTTPISPDTGGAPRTEDELAIVEDYRARYPDYFDGQEVKMAVAYKRRRSADQVDIRWVTGAHVIEGRDVVIIDDIISTGTTAMELGRKLRRELGAKRTALCATHGVCANRAWEKLGPDVFDLVLVGDTLPVRDRLPDPLPPNWRVVSLAPVLASAIQQICARGSLTRLWQERPPLPVVPVF